MTLSPKKVEKINKRISPIQDEYIEKYLSEKKLNLIATLDAEAAYKDAILLSLQLRQIMIVRKISFDTSAVEAVIQLVIKCNPGVM